MRPRIFPNHHGHNKCLGQKIQTRHANSLQHPGVGFMGEKKRKKSAEEAHLHPSKVQKSESFEAAQKRKYCKLSTQERDK